MDAIPVPAITGHTDTASLVARAAAPRTVPPSSWSPATVRWSPDGTMLAVDALIDGDPALRHVLVYTLADNTVRRMTDTPDGRTWLLGWAPVVASLVSREIGSTGVREA